MTRDEMLTGLATGEIQPIIHSTIARTFLTDKDITHDEVAQRRRELINEPDDADAPEWARFKAQDKGGTWYWYEARPVALSEDAEWHENGGDLQMSLSGQIPAGHDWRETLKPVEQELPAPKWDGESWPPPVGCIVEVARGIQGDWMTAEVLAVRNGKAIVYTPDTDLVGWIEEDCTRPIRTPEQRAEDEAVEEMIEALRDFPREKQEGRSKGVCRRLYRAGYRKP